MYVCIYIYMCICMYIYNYICEYVYIYIYIFIHMYTYHYIRMFKYVHILNVHIHVRLHVCIMYPINLLLKLSLKTQSNLPKK